MFILRQKAFSPHPPFECNLILGTSYSLVWRDGGGDDFAHLAKNAIDSENVYGFVVYNEGADTYPLYLPFAYYIMASDGKTFSNISFK